MGFNSAFKGLIKGIVFGNPVLIDSHSYSGMLCCATSQKMEGPIQFCLQALKNVRKLLLVYESYCCNFPFFSSKNSSDVS